MQNSQGFSQGVFLSQGISHIFHSIFTGFHPIACPEDKPSQTSGGYRLKTCWGHKISSSSPTHDMMIITFFTFIILLSLKFFFFFSENTYNTNYSRSVLLYTVSLFKPLRGFNKHQWPTKHVGYFAHRGRLLFYTKKKQLV